MRQGDAASSKFGLSFIAIGIEALIAKVLPYIVFQLEVVDSFEYARFINFHAISNENAPAMRFMAGAFIFLYRRRKPIFPRDSKL